MDEFGIAEAMSMAQACQDMIGAMQTAMASMQAEIDQLRSMIPLGGDGGDDGGNDGGGDAKEYICGDYSNVVFTDAGNNQVKVDVFYV